MRSLAGLVGLSILSVAAFADGEGLTPVTGEASVSLETKALTYGLPDAKIAVPEGLFNRESLR